MKINSNITILRESESRYQFVFTATRIVKTFEVDGLVKAVITLATDGLERSELEASLGDHFPVDQVRRCILALQNEGILLEDEPVVEPRFRRQLAFLSEAAGSWKKAKDAQSRLRAARIAVVGVGGVGSWIVNGLIQMGVGELRIVDSGRVEESNLNRQVLFDATDVGKYKADVIANKYRECRIRPWRKRLDIDDDLSEAFSDVDLVVNCADEPSVATTSELLSTYSARMNVPFSIAGGYNMHIGMVGPIIPLNARPCFRCILRSMKETTPFERAELVKEADQTGSIGAIAGVIGNLHVGEIFKFLTSTGTVLSSRFIEFNFLKMEFDRIECQVWPDCPSCNPRHTNTPMSLALFTP